MDTVEYLRRKFHSLEKRNLELNNQCNQEMSCHEKEIIQLRLELERKEALRQHLESEMSFARKEAHTQMYSTQDELCDVKNKVLELQAVLNDKYQQKAAETEKMVQSAQWQLEEERRRFAVERENIHKVHLAELEFPSKAKAEAEMACQKTNAALQSIARQLNDVAAEHHGYSKMLRLQANHLDFKDKWQERLVKEAAAVKIKELKENAAAAKLAHINCKHTTEIMQLRIQELEDVLNEEQRGTRAGFSGVARNDFRESENAHERGRKGSRRQRLSSSVRWRDQVEETEESSGTLVSPPASFSLHEGSMGELSILLNLYQSLANAHVLAKQTNVPLEELPWAELCALLHESVEALILNFHKAEERIPRLEYICKHKNDTINDLQQKLEDAFRKVSEQLKAQEHCWQQEKQYLEQHYSDVLAEADARAQRNIAILQQEIFEFSRRLHAAQAESHSLHLQLAECRGAFSEMQKDAENAQGLQNKLNELQQKINKDNIQVELDKALQREQEAKLLLQEYQRRLQELSSTLQPLSFTNIDRSQVSSVSLMSLPEELRRRDRVLDQQKRLLKDMEQDQQELWESLKEAELALEQEVK